MKTSKIIYNPQLTIEENAINNKVTKYAIRWYIKTNGIDRKRDNAIILQRSINEFKKNNPNKTLREISDALDISVNTVRKYLKETVSISNIDSDKLSTFDTSKRKFIISSVSYNQEEILFNILRLYVKEKNYDCDLTYSKGNFYNNIPQPRLKYDKYPQSPDVMHLNEAYKIEDNSLHSVIVDLPFVVKNYNSMMADRFNCFDNIKELYSTYEHMLQFTVTKLDKGGFLVIKTMDLNYGGVQHWICNFVQNKALEIGFKMVDIFILLAKTKVLTTANPTQCHARKFHSYFLVFQKK